MTTFDFGLRFESSPNRLKGEKERRAKLVARELRFNVDFLDDALGGILPNDLIILGARTGAGKTALASMIAQGNAKQGKRVHYFALEAEDDEIERRMKYRALVALYRAAGNASSSRLSYRNWYRGKVDDLLDPFEAAAEEALSAYGTLQTYYRGESFDVEDLDRTFRAIREQTDLIILDHLHYVDSDDPNENRAYKEVTKRIRDISLSSGVPVLVIAHLRKKDRGGPRRLMPDIDDFHGSSDVTKIATKCILIAPAPQGDEQHSSYRWGTYMQCCKDRMDGSLVRYCALTHYDVRFSTYDASYELGAFNVEGTEWSASRGHDLPHWADRAKRPEPERDRWGGDDEDDRSDFEDGEPSQLPLAGGA